ncbi:alpha-ketoacid dehydrogenase subunit beta [Nocardia sp. CA-290969]|uniref:alpha-ketoacid dehydrogenase subunit beta n=1 Tax=Nocardia sp. CA-290969 TaxID=3239986 RepID=UPI003D8EDBFB
MTATTVPLRKALNEGLRRALEDDDKVVLMGEDIGSLGGVFRITDGLQKDFGPARVIDTPLAESGIIGTAVGLAMRGYRPVCEIQFDGFIYPAFDQIVSQVAKLHYRTSGNVKMPITIRVPYGGGIGAIEHHSESPEGYFAATAGLRVVTCGNVGDAYTMIQQAIASDDPVLFFEPKRRYSEKGQLDPDAEAFPLYKARVLTPGTDATLLAYGPLVTTALRAAEIAAQEGRSLEVIDLRSISPLDLDTIAESVRRTGRLVITHEAPVFLGIGAEIAARITERCFFHLEAPVERVGGFTLPYPPAKLEEHFLPDADRILDAVDRTFAA